MRDQEFARFFLVTEMWVSTSGVQKVWRTLDRPEIDLHTNGLDKLSGVLFLIKPADMNAYIV